MKTYQVKIKETLCMTVEVEAENAQLAEAMVQQAYKMKNMFSTQNILLMLNLLHRKKKLRPEAGLKKMTDMNADLDSLFRTVALENIHNL